MSEITTQKIAPLGWISSIWIASGISFIALYSTAAIMFDSLGLPDNEISFWTSFIMVLGSFVAGYFVAARTFNRKTLLFLCTAMNLSLLVYAYLALFQPVDETHIMLMVAFQHFCYGFGLLSEYMGFYDFYIWILICTIPAYFVSALIPLNNTNNTTAS